MSVRARFNITGTAICFNIFFVGILLLVWFLPTIGVPSENPFLMNVNDLTMERSFLNSLSKPGFRILVMLGWILVYIWVQLVVQCVTKSRHIVVIEAKKVLESMNRTGEWVVEGKSMLTEFAQAFR